MSKIKTYFKDYAEAQKVCNEFQRKHWLGNFMVVAIALVLTFLVPVLYLKHKEKKENELVIRTENTINESNKEEA